MPEDDLMADGRPDAYIYDPEADAARAAMAVTPEDFGEPELPDWAQTGDATPGLDALAYYDDGAAVLVAIDVEIPEGW